MQVIPSASGIYDATLAPLPKALQSPPIDSDAIILERLHGPFVSWRKHCATCFGEKHFKTRLGDGTIVTCECNCREQWILGCHMKAANIDDVYARMSWHRIQTVPDEVVRKVQNYVADLSLYRTSGLGLTLWSERRGTGKTLLTTLILKEAMASGAKVYFTRFVDLINTYSKTWKDDSFEAWFVRCVEQAALLGIDDIGKESAQSDSAVGMVNQLLDRMLRGRVANGRPMIVNSNLDPDADQVGKGFDRYQQDVLELLGEVNETIEVGGVSYRKISREQKISDAREGIVYPLVVR